MSARFSAPTNVEVTVDLTKSNDREAFRISPPYEPVREYLISDLQSPRSIRKELELVRSIASGAAPPDESDGNAYVAVIGPVTTKIECFYDEEIVEVPTDVLIIILEHWLEYMIARVGEA